MELRKFVTWDIPWLISCIPDEAACRQWSGHFYPFPLSPEEIEEIRNSPGEEHNLFTLESDNSPIGHIRISTNPERTTGHIGSVLVDPQWRGRGVGRILLDQGITQGFEVMGLSRLTLRVFLFNHSAVALYKKLGFRVDSQEPGPLDGEGRDWSVLSMSRDRE